MPGWPKTKREAGVQSEGQSWEYILFLGAGIDDDRTTSMQGVGVGSNHMALKSGCLELTVEFSHTSSDLSTQPGAGSAASDCWLIDITSTDQHHEINLVNKYL